MPTPRVNNHTVPIPHPVVVIVLICFSNLIISVECMLAVFILPSQPSPDSVVVVEPLSSSPLSHICQYSSRVLWCHQPLIRECRLEAHVHMQSTGIIHTTGIACCHPCREVQCANSFLLNYCQRW